MWKSVVVGVLLLAAIALGAGILFLIVKTDPPVPAPVAPAPAPVAAPAPAPDESALLSRDREIARLRARVTDLEQRLAAATNAASAARNFRLAGGPHVLTAGTNGAAGPLVEGIQKMLANPEFLRSLAANAGRARGRTVEARYAALAASLGLAPERAAELYALLKQRRAGDADTERRLREMLGDQGYAALQGYEKTLPARDEVFDFEQRLARGGRSLSDSQRRAMIELFDQSAAGREAQALQVELKPGQSMSEAVRSSMDQSMNSWDQVMSSAKAVLEPGQLAELDGFLGDRLQRREAEAKVVEGINVMSFGGAGGAMPITVSAQIVTDSNVEVATNAPSAP